MSFKNQSILRAVYRNSERAVILNVAEFIRGNVFITSRGQIIEIDADIERDGKLLAFDKFIPLPGKSLFRYQKHLRKATYRSRESGTKTIPGGGSYRHRTHSYPGAIAAPTGGRGSGFSVDTKPKLLL